MRPKRRGIAMTVIGALLMLVLAPASAVLGFVIGLKQGIGHVTNAPIVAVGRPYHLPAGSSVMLFAYAGPSSGGTGVSSSRDVPPMACTVRASDGTPVDVTGQSGVEVTRGGSAYDMSGHFTAPRDDDYAIRCGDHPAMVLDSGIADHLLRSIILPIGVGLGIAVLIGVAGVILLIIGIVALVRSRRRIREFDEQQAGLAYAGGPPYAGPPPGQGPPPGTAYPPPPENDPQQPT